MDWTGGIGKKLISSIREARDVPGVELFVARLAAVVPNQVLARHGIEKLELINGLLEPIKPTVPFDYYMETVAEIYKFYGVCEIKDSAPTAYFITPLLESVVTWRPTESPETAWLVARDLLGLLVQGPTGRQTDLLYREQLSAIDYFRLNLTIDALIGQLLTVDGALAYSPEHTAKAIHHLTSTFAFDVSITYGLSAQIQTLNTTAHSLIADHNVTIRPGTRAMIELVATLQLAHAQLMAPLDPDTPAKNDEFLKISNQALASLTLIPDPLMAPHWLDSGTDIAPLIQVLRLQMEWAQNLTWLAVDHFFAEPHAHPLAVLKTHHDTICGVTETMDHLVTEMFTLSKKMCTLTCDSYIIFSAWNLVSGWNVGAHFRSDIRPRRSGRIFSIQRSKPSGIPPFPSDQTAGLYLWWPRLSDGSSIPASGFAPENKI